MVNIDRNIIRGFIILSYVLIVSILIFLISSLYSYLNTGADRSKILHTEVKKIDQYLPKVLWQLDGNEGRHVDQQTLNNIEIDYLDAWYVRHIAYKTNRLEGIDDYYTENARKNLVHFIDQHKESKITIEATTLEHHPDVIFFSEDGQLIVLNDNNVVEFKKIYKEEKLITVTKEISNYKMILLLEDGFWRIRHLIKENVTNKNDTFINIPIDSLVINNIKGINYYPQATPWNMFNEEFDIQILKKDFEIIKDAGLNTIRVFIPYENFGKAKVKDEKLEKLEKLLDTAKSVNLKVIVTLFDFYGNYEILDWTLNERHVEKIVSKFKNHEAIIAWDIKNEPNLDFKSRGKEKVISWLTNIINYVKSIDQNHPITIGWSDTESASILKDKVDFVSFHYYKSPNKFETAYLKLKDSISKKPIVLGEFGISSYNGFWKPFASSEKKQALYYKDMQKKLKKYNIPFLSWTLYDFDKVPNTVVGKLPWRVHPQKKYGFIKKDGSKKPSYKYISK